MFRIRQQRLAICLSAILAACGSEPDASVDPDSGVIADSGPDADFDGSSAPIGAGGGTVAIEDGELAGSSVEVPEGALDEEVEIRIGPGTDIAEPQTLLAGPAVELGPEGQEFAVPVTVTIPYDRTVAPFGTHDSLVVLKRSDASGEVTLLPADDVAVDTEAGLVAVQVSSFSTVQAAFEDESAALVGDYNGLSLALSLQGPDAANGAEVGVFGSQFTADFDGERGGSLSETTHFGALRLQATPPEVVLVRGAEVAALSYAVVGQGRATIRGTAAALSSDGELLVGGLHEVDDTGGMAGLLLALKAGTGMSAADLSGAYHLVAVGVTARVAAEGQVVDSHGLSMIATGDGEGSLALTGVEGSDSKLVLSHPTSLETVAAVDVPPAIPYEVASDGALTLGGIGGAFHGALSAGGEIFAFTINGADSSSVYKELVVAVRQGAGLDTSVLSGRYNVFAIEPRLSSTAPSDPEDPEAPGRAEVHLTTTPAGIVDFDGQGGASFRQLPRLTMGLVADADYEFVRGTGAGEPPSSYAVSAEGKLTVGPLAGGVNPSGSVFALTLTEEVDGSDGGSSEVLRLLVVGVRQPE